jgi:hypothetical protein
VTGSATIAGPAGPVDCWGVTTDDNRPGSVSTFWFAKGTQLMVRQESAVGDSRIMTSQRAPILRSWSRRDSITSARQAATETWWPGSPGITWQPLRSRSQKRWVALNTLPCSGEQAACSLS